MVFVLVVVFTVVQGGTIAAGRPGWLRVTAPAEPTELRVETAPLDRMRADLLRAASPGGLAAGRRVRRRAAAAAGGGGDAGAARRGRASCPDPRTRLRAGDSLLIVATADVRDAAERRLRAVSRRGRLARWLGEAGPIGRG